MYGHTSEFPSAHTIRVSVPGAQAEGHVAACCGVLWYVAVCCSVLQCVAVCCSVLQRVAVWCSVLQCVALDSKSTLVWHGL